MPLVVAVTVYGNTHLFAGVCAFIVLLGTWEWAGLIGFSSTWHKYFFVLAIAIFLASYYSIMNESLSVFIACIAILWWFFAFIMLYNKQRGRDIGDTVVLKTFMCLIILIPAWISLVALHNHPSLGPIVVLVLFMLVWSADMGAYYTGRKWGRKKLAGEISPGKTWEGLFGAIISGLLISMLYSLLMEMPVYKIILFLVISLITINASVIGDLMESLMKRSAGVKDSGKLLPGHGGVLDRIDSLTAAAPVFFTCVWLLER